MRYLVTHVSFKGIKDDNANHDVLFDLFGCIECFFKRLEAYTNVRPTAAMTDIVVKIIVEVLSILGITTKEIKQGRMSMSIPVHNYSKVDVCLEKYFKALVGWTDVEDSLQRLDRLTQEGARMAAAEALKIAQGIEGKVTAMDNGVDNVDRMVQAVLEKAEDIDDQLHGVNDEVQNINNKVSTVIEGEISGSASSVVFRPFAGLDGKEIKAALQQLVDQVSDINRS